MRQRMLLPPPGSASVVTGQCHCCSSQGRRCGQDTDVDGTHELLCPVGGGANLRHNQVKEWLTDKLRDACGGRTLLEQPHPYASMPGNGRMDIKHDNACGHLDIDVTILSLFFVECSRDIASSARPHACHACSGHGETAALWRWGVGLCGRRRGRVGAPCLQAAEAASLPRCRRGGGRSYFHRVEGGAATPGAAIHRCHGPGGAGATTNCMTAWHCCLCFVDAARSFR